MKKSLSKMVKMFLIIAILASMLIPFEVQATASGSVLQLHVVNTGSAPNFYYMKFSNASYTFQSGDYIEYDVKLLHNEAGAGGIDIITTDGTCMREVAGWQDQNGISGHPFANISAYAYNTWYHRKLAVPVSMVGKTVSRWDVVGESDTYNASYMALYDNIVVTNGSGVERKRVFKDAGDNNVNAADIWVSNANAGLYISDINGVRATDNPRVVTPTFSSEDIIIANYVVTESPYNADNTGVNDATGAIQQALNDCMGSGGGVVYIPAGKYKVTNSITIPHFVTLRGDWRDPDTSGSSYGTVIMAHVASGGATDPALFRLSTNTGVKGLTIFYPNQSASSPVQYPYTFDVPIQCMNQTIENCTLLNSYRGINIGLIIQTEQHKIKNVKGTVLSNPLYISNVSEASVIQRCTFNNSYWANSGSAFNAPSRSTLDTWTRANGTGLILGDAEWETITELSLSDYNVGIHIIDGPRTTETGSVFGSSILNCNKALVVDSIDDRVGYQFASCTFTTNSGSSRYGVEVNYNTARSTSKRASLLFNNCTFGGSPTNAVKLNGDVMVNLQNCTFSNWIGTYAIDATAGTVVASGCTFTPALSSSKKGIYLRTNVSSASIIQSAFSGTASYLLDNNSSGNVWRQDTGYYMANHTISSHTWKTNKPKPSNNFYNVKNLPSYVSAVNAYGDADKANPHDDTIAIQNALTYAGNNGGGTVYLPVGQYRINTRLSVPSGVELRGAWDVPHRSESKGTVLYVYEGKDTPNSDTAAAFITLNGTNAGVKGVTIYHPEQALNTSTNTVKAFPYVIRGNGSGVYAINVTFVNAFKGVDFHTNNCSNHYLDFVCGTVLNNGIIVGNSSVGWMENCLFNGTYWTRTDLPNKLDESQIFTTLFVYTRANLKAYILGGAQNEHMLSNFVYGSNTGFYMQQQGALGGPNATLINCAVDGSWEGFRIDATGSNGVTMINSETCGVSQGTDCDALHIAGGDVKVYNIMGMEFNDKTIRITGGTSQIRGGVFQHKMGLVSAGTSNLIGVLFKDSGTHVTVKTGSTSNLWGNIGGGSSFNCVFESGTYGGYSGNIRR